MELNGYPLLLTSLLQGIRSLFPQHLINLAGWFVFWLVRFLVEVWWRFGGSRHEDNVATTLDRATRCILGFTPDPDPERLTCTEMYKFRDMMSTSLLTSDLSTSGTVLE